MPTYLGSTICAGVSNGSVSIDSGYSYRALARNNTPTAATAKSTTAAFVPPPKARATRFCNPQSAPMTFR